MKYPYIGKCINGTVLFSSKGVGTALEKEFGAWTNISKIKFSDGWAEFDFKNITREYLSNTWGAVESKEHAEFIIKLAELHGFESSGGFMDGCDKYFYTFEDCLEFTSSGDTARSDGEKQITIPLPPKEPLKNAGDNLIFGCEDSKCDEWKAIEEDIKYLSRISRAWGPLKSKSDEWPQVGSIVTWGNKSVKGEVRALSDDLAWIKNEYGNYCSEHVSSLQKPKTPEEELRDDIMQLIDGASGLSPHALALALMDKYNITKKPQ